MKRYVSALFALVLGGCAAAQMVQPASLAEVAPIRIEQIGGGRSGQFSFTDGHDAFAGRFVRSADGLSYFNTIKDHRGTTDFTLTGPHLSAPLSARCDFAERVLEIGIFTSTPERFAYRCSFLSDGRAIPARFELQEGPSATLKRDRRGEIALDRVILQIRSIHRIERSPLPVAAPIGYLFERDGMAVGSVEINGTPEVRIFPTDDPAVRRAVYVGALALALLWDPANNTD